LQTLVSITKAKNQTNMDDTTIAGTTYTQDVHQKKRNLIFIYINPAPFKCDTTYLMPTATKFMNYIKKYGI
jgi:hypothetical protein